MQTDSDKVQLSISLHATHDRDVIAWCAAHSNLSAAFRDLVRSSMKYSAIMSELQAIRTAVENIKTVEKEAKPTAAKKKKITLDPEAQNNLNALGNF